MSLVKIIEPAVEPLTLEEAKLQCRVEHSEDDALIQSLITAARSQAELYLNRALITQTWERVLDSFPESAILLGLGPVQTVASLKYRDLSGVEQTLGAELYALDKDSGLQEGYVLPAIDTEWPDTLDTANAVRVRFTTGFGASASSVPAEILVWMKLWVSTFYKHRELTVVAASVSPVPASITESMLHRHRAFYWG